MFVLKISSILLEPAFCETPCIFTDFFEVNILIVFYGTIRLIKQKLSPTELNFTIKFMLPTQ